MRSDTAFLSAADIFRLSRGGGRRGSHEVQPYQFWRCESTADGSGVSHAAPRAGGGVDAALSGLRVCWDAQRVESSPPTRRPCPPARRGQPGRAHLERGHSAG